LAAGSADEDAALEAESDVAGAIFQDLFPRFEGLLPVEVVRDCVDKAVRDLLGSISAEALPEMAVRLASVRLERSLGATGQMSDERPPFAVIRPSTTGYLLLALTLTMTRAPWNGVGCDDDEPEL
jgi:hypothetical protein